MAIKTTEEEMTVEEFLEHFGQDGADALAHYGVLGMKWGHHKAQGGDSGGGSPSKALDAKKNAGRVQKMDRNLGAEAKAKAQAKSQKHTSAEILNARHNTNLKVQKIFEADAKYRLATTQKGKDKALKEVQMWGKRINESSETYVAAKSTRGEKVAKGVLVALGAMSVAGMVAGR